MAMAKYIVLACLLVFLALGARGDAGFEPQEPQIETCPGSDLVKELEDLKSKASSLESMIEEKKSALREKEALVAEREKLLEEKSKAVTILQSEIESIQKKGAGALEAETTKAYARVKELEKQVEKLEEVLREQKQRQQSLELHASKAENQAKEYSDKSKKMEKLEEVLREQKQRQQSLELQASKAENQAKEFSDKNMKLQEVVTEQKARMQKVEQALQFAEATMLKYQSEAKMKAEQLMEVHGAWLPHWLAVRLAKFQAYAAEHWAKSVMPAINVVLEKASEKASIAHNWARPHLETAKTHWSPALKKQWQQAMVSLAPHVETVKSKAIEGYEVSRDTIKPHLVKAHESLSPHVQTVKDLCGPYIDQVVAASQPHIEKVVAASQPHIEKATVILQPYTKPIANVYGRFLTTATKYHRQLQRSVRQTLKKYELTAALATKELVWFMASALLALPVFGILMAYSAVFSSGKKARKPGRNNPTGHVHKKHKRRHIDK